VSNQKKILKDRAEAKRKELEARLAHLKADTREGAANEVARIRTALDDLAEAAKRGWDNLTDAIAAKINRIIDVRDEEKN
jgi:hypothetical protein